MGRLVTLAERIEQGMESSQEQLRAAVAYLRENSARLIADAAARVGLQDGAKGKRKGKGGGS